MALKNSDFMGLLGPLETSFRILLDPWIKPSDFGPQHNQMHREMKLRFWSYELRLSLQYEGTWHTHVGSFFLFCVDFPFSFFFFLIK